MNETFTMNEASEAIGVSHLPSGKWSKLDTCSLKNGGDESEAAKKARGASKKWGAK
jgi:hypothetical protein